VGTLRYLINQLNADSANFTSEEIDFNIGTVGSAQTIDLTSALPALTASGVFINGLSQGGNGNTTQLITLNGSNAGSDSDGLLLQGSNCTVSGLILEDFGKDGIEVEGSNDVIGGSVASAANTIAYNLQSGVNVASGNGNTVRLNSIFGNNGSGITLASGTNNNLAAPTLTSAPVEDGTLFVKGSFMPPKANGSYILDFYANASGDAEGRVYLVLQRYKRIGDRRCRESLAARLRCW
jgi:hypothetical protein